MYTPGIVLTAGVTYTLNFNQKVYSSSYPEIFEVKCGSAANPAGQTITILASASYTNTTCTLRSPTFTVPTTGTYYISWHCTSAAYMWHLIIDDITLTHASTPSCTVQTCTPSCSNPTQPVISSVNDLNACSQSGVRVTFTAGSPSTSNVLVVDGAEMATGITSPYDYNPGNTTSHNYVVRTYNTASCHTDSAVTAKADGNDTPTLTITGDSVNTCPSETVMLRTESGMSSYQWYNGGSPIGGATSNTYTVSASGTYTVSYTNGSGCSGTSVGYAVTISACACTAPTQEIIETVNTDKSGFCWTATDADNYRVMRGVKAELPNLASSANDGCLKYFGGSTCVTITSDDPSADAGRFSWYIIQGVNGADPCLNTCAGPTGPPFTRLVTWDCSTTCP